MNSRRLVFTIAVFVSFIVIIIKASCDWKSVVVGLIISLKPFRCRQSSAISA